MNTLPHASWAEVYDLTYESFPGGVYQYLTDISLRAIEDVVSPPASIIDFGAGTGRLAIPLAQRGFDVMAVEPSREMLQQLHQKVGGESVESHCSTIEEWSTEGSKNERLFDMGLCVFTVLSYISCRCEHGTFL